MNFQDSFKGFSIFVDFRKKLSLKYVKISLFQRALAQVNQFRVISERTFESLVAFSTSLYQKSCLFE